MAKPGGQAVLEKEPESYDSWTSPNADKWGSGDGWGAPASETWSASGWLESGTSEPQAGRGWLGDPQIPSESSMTEIIDYAFVSAQEEFVDDSWVDEEIRDQEFDDFETPPLQSEPSPEVGAAFLKMLLVAAMVVLLGGGLMFVNQDQKTPDELAAEQRSKLLQSAQAYVLDGEQELQAGAPDLAVLQFESALTNLSDAGASRSEIDKLELRLCQAMMKANEYEKSLSHWQSLAQSPDPEVAKAAQSGLATAKKEKRREANALLATAKAELKTGGTYSPRNLAKDALYIYEKFGGSTTQVADAYGVIGLSFVNSQEYGSAQSYLEKAIRTQPALKSEYNSALAKVKLYKMPVAQVRPSNTEVTKTAVFDPGTPDYVTSNHQAVYRPANTNKTEQTFVTNVPEGPQKMKEIAAHKPAQQKKQGWLGQNGVHNGYR